ncbi:hypothetical protein BSL78_09672 [Apostichopus japonicus]|uniref:PHD-type domain-containing protein n=1 Tax=Stichopus japonicus TaxID=307972 RepID=A0A2G8KZP5_STIJA|nr:hypothetical protein BSL78_09672 [Apostichopus japonicus]
MLLHTCTLPAYPHIINVTPKVQCAGACADESVVVEWLRQLTGNLRFAGSSPGQIMTLCAWTRHLISIASHKPCALLGTCEITCKYSCVTRSVADVAIDRRPITRLAVSASSVQVKSNTPQNKPKGSVLTTTVATFQRPQMEIIPPKKPEKHLIKINFLENFEMDVLWRQGVSLISSEPFIPRIVCFLCGSLGKHDLLYCNVCCEGFHEFCLEGEDHPLENENRENWCCRNCKVCNVCGRQNKLLTCDKCHTCYHAECLGPNYPTKKSKRRRIWICSRCVKCRSCGSTSPGKDPKASWSSDFSLCEECAALFRLGNYCPICRQCYEADDFESKMMQCGQCNVWVHSKCENLTDDLYNILTDLPDTIPYLCEGCEPDRPAPWQIEIEEELQAGFTNVMKTMFACKMAGHLIWPHRKFRYLGASKKPALPGRSPSPSSSDSSIIRYTPEPPMSEATDSESPEASNTLPRTHLGLDKKHPSDESNVEDKRTREERDMGRVCGAEGGADGVSNVNDKIDRDIPGGNTSKEESIRSEVDRLDRLDNDACKDIGDDDKLNTVKKEMEKCQKNEKLGPRRM